MSHTAEQTKMIREIYATKGKKAALEFIASINDAEYRKEESKDKGEFLASLLKSKVVYQTAIDKMDADIVAIVGDFDETATDDQGFPVKHPRADVLRKMRFETAQIRSRLGMVTKQISEIGA